MAALAAAGLLVALSVPALGMHFKDPGFDGYSRSQPVIQTYDRLQAAFPGDAAPTMTVIKAPDVTAAPVQAAIRASPRPGAGHGPAVRALTRRDQPRQDRRRRRLSVKGAAPTARAPRGPALRRRAGHRRQARRRRGRRHRPDRGHEGLHRGHDRAHAARVRLRRRPHVPPAADHVPLDRGPDQGDRPEPAVGRRGLRRARARLPGRPRRVAAQLPIRSAASPPGSRCFCS